MGGEPLAQRRGRLEFGTLTTHQYNSHYAGAHSGNPDDQALDSTAVVLDGNVTSAEVTAEPIPAGNVHMTGGGSTGFTQAQATDLADALKYGSLPLDFQLLNESTVSAQLGHSSLVAGLTSGSSGCRWWRSTCSLTTGPRGGWRSPACCWRRRWPTCWWSCSAGTSTSR